MTEHLKKLSELQTRYHSAMSGLLVPARAAFNAMKDAKMDNTARDLGEAIFKIDSIADELKSGAPGA